MLSIEEPIEINCVIEVESSLLVRKEEREAKRSCVDVLKETANFIWDENKDFREIRFDLYKSI